MLFTERVGCLQVGGGKWVTPQYHKLIPLLTPALVRIDCLYRMHSLDFI